LLTGIPPKVTTSLEINPEIPPLPYSTENAVPLAL
jgi:hypothetical protein